MLGVLCRSRAASATIAALALQFCFSPQAWPQGSGVRVANTTLRLPLQPPIIGFGITNLFGDLRFEDPVCVKSPPGATNQLFVVERTGRIMVVTNLAAPNKTVFLDLSKITYSAYLEAGLLGLAFHPGFDTNRYFYVFRTAFTTTTGATNLLHDVLSRFEVSPTDANVALPGSEQRLIAQYDDSITHNAGDVAFGPDGYLYVSLGDSSPPPRDRSDDPQAIDKGFFGGIIRVDVDKRPGSLPPNPHPSCTTNYAVPPDNPFIGRTSHNGLSIDPHQVRTEFYAIGLRNPWRMAFDSVTGDLYCGDVGAVDFEEINLIEKGSNYGWPHQEGPLVNPSPPPGFNLVTALYQYAHGYEAYQGKCVIGGVTYRGMDLPDLNGAYLFADTYSGNIWALRHDGTNVTALQRIAGEEGIVAFGRDPTDEGILLANFKKGIIQKLIYSSPSRATGLPETLAETGIFSNLSTLTPHPGILPYEVNVPFWSDYASKKRWFSVPDTNTFIAFDPTGPWTFPTGTVWIKQFDLELTNGVPESARRLETRLLIKNGSGIYGITYRWDESQTNATLVDQAGLDETFLVRDAGLLRTQVWHYPSRTECLICHTPTGGYALGFDAAQLHRDVQVENFLTNQIAYLCQLGYFQNNSIDISSFRPLAAVTNMAYPVGYRAKSFLTANCAQCHQPGAMREYYSWDARFQIPLVDANILDGLLFGGGSQSEYRVLKPGDPDHSAILSRVGARGRIQMPPLATSLIDSNAVNLLCQWITTFPSSPWQTKDIGVVAQEGFDSVNDGTFQVSGSGQGIAGVADSFHFLYQPLQGDLQSVTRLGARLGGGDDAQAGIMFRDGVTASAPFVMIRQNPAGEILFSRRVAMGGEVENESIGRLANTNAWLRLVRQGNLVSGYVSDDGVQWGSLVNASVNWGANIAAGFAVASRHEPALHTVDFQEVSLIATKLTVVTAPPFLAPASTIALEAQIAGDKDHVRKVEFFANGNKLGESTTAPYVLDWSQVPAGTYVLTAHITDVRGAVLVSSPVELIVNLPEANVGFIGKDTVTGGNWPGTYGSDGCIIVGDADHSPEYVAVAVPYKAAVTWAAATSAERALLTTDGETHVAAAWSAENALSVNTTFIDGKLHQLTLYFLDWYGDNTLTETVELWDARTGILLDQQTVSAFSGGAYLRWAVRGNVRIRIVGQAGASALLSGLFFDPADNLPPSIRLTNPADGSVFVLPATIAIGAEASDSDGQIAKVEFFVNGRKFRQLAGTPYSFEWTNAWQGTYTVTARAIDNRGESQVSDRVTITVVAPQAAVEFVGSDPNTQGDWIGRYGFNGFVVPGYITNYPPFVLVHPEHTQAFVWSDQSDESRAIQHTNGILRVASCWFDNESLSLDVGFMDGGGHKVSLYFLDWDGFGSRVSTVDVIDAASGAVLDRRTVSGFSNGAYYAWNVRGRIRFQITRLTSNAVLSGLFLDPLIVSSRAPRLSARQLSLSALPSLQLDLRGVPNYPYRIELSTDLINWVPGQVRIASPSGRIIIFDSLDNDSSVRFYRAVLQH